MGLLDHVREFAEAFNEGAQLGRTVGTCHALISNMSRDDAAQKLLQLLDGMSAEQWQEFKIEYLQFTLTIISSQKKIRSTELFAFMNLLESQYYQRFPYFFTDGRALS